VHKGEQRNAWRIALLTTGAVLLAGLIGAGSAYLTANVQAHSQAQQAREDFVRTQRQALYAKLSTEDTIFKAKVTECIQRAENAGEHPLSLAEVNTINASVTDIVDGLSSDMAVLSVVGSQEAISTITILKKAQDKAQEECAVFLHLELFGKHSQTAFALQDDQCWLALSDTDNAHHSFLAYAQRDIQA
jgi:hypothetical protein